MKHEPVDERLLAEIGEQCGALALRCSETAGFISRVSCSIEVDHGRIDLLQRSIDQLVLLQREAQRGAHEIRTVAHRATALIGESHRSMLSALGEIGALIDDVVRMGDEVAEFSQSIEDVASISENLRGITRQTSILALNASIEAARGGKEASGITAIAAEMKKLALRAADATSSVSRNIESLEGSARSVVADLSSGADKGRSARERARGISTALESVSALIVQFDQSSAAIQESGGGVTRHVNTVVEGLDSFAATATDNLARLRETCAMLDELEMSTNTMFNRIGHSGIETGDTGFVEMALGGAQAVRAIIDQGLAKAAITLDQLFDTAYQPIPASDPVQFLTTFVPFADWRIRPLLDAQTARDERIVGCCLVDRNGFLPTHISARSHDQRREDRAWNLEHARNRQIFMDRQTRAALDGKGDWFLYTYRQDLGGGNFRALRSVFVPLAFGGRRWGLYELGYLI